MALEVSNLERKFIHNGNELPDPNPQLSLREVAKAYSGTYPELLNSNPEFKEIKDGVEYYDFSAKAGLKG